MVIPQPQPPWPAPPTPETPPPPGPPPMPDPDPHPQPPIQENGSSVFFRHARDNIPPAVQEPPGKQEPDPHPDLEPAKAPPGKALPPHQPEPFPVTPAPSEPPVADPPWTEPPPIHSGGILRSTIRVRFLACQDERFRDEGNRRSGGRPHANAYMFRGRLPGSRDFACGT